MNHKQVHALLSKASEAIVSEDGRLQRKIHNYETVIGAMPDDPLYIPGGAVNDNYGNLNNHITIAGKRFAKITLLRYAMYSTVVVVLFGFAWSLLSLVMPSWQQIKQEETRGVSSPTDTRLYSELQLERIANLILRDGNWDKTRIEIFIKEWNESSQDAKDIYRTKVWFQHFSYRLKTKFHEERNMGTFVKHNSSSAPHPIMALAFALEIADSNIDYAKLDLQETKINEIAEQVSNELAKLEQAKLTAVSSEKEQQTDRENLALNTQLLEKLGIAPLQNTDAVSTGSLIPVSQEISQQFATSEPTISDQDIQQVLKKYAVAYESGDMQELSSLFGLDQPESGRHAVAQLKRNFEFIFENSDKRSVNFNGVNWRAQGNKAEVSSDYRADIELKNNKGKQTVSASAKVDMELSNNQILITRFELLDRNVNVITPELKLASIKEIKKPEGPTAADLQDVVTRLIDAYESGDIAGLTNLFAKNVQTNDQKGLAGIEKDYKELFASTTDRQMFIQGLQWSYDESSAKGNGNLEAVVLSEAEGSVYTMTGTIQIVARRIDDKVLITHLYHSERTP
jgi:hypothetical protein